MRLKRIRLLHYVFLTFTLFFLVDASFFPFLRVSGLQNGSYQFRSNGTVDYPPPPSVYPFWSADSYWHKKIPVDAKVHPNSAQMIDWLMAFEDHNDGHPTINYKRWTAPVYDAYASTPKHTVQRLDFGDYLYNVPIPDGATPDQESDGWMIIIDWYNWVAYDFWRIRQENGQWICNAGWKWDLSGSGVGVDGKWTVHGSSTMLLAMIIRPEEIEAGVIEHPLACAFRWTATRKTNHVYPPACTTDGKSTNSLAILEGSRIQLNPNLNLDSYGLSRTAKIIAKALQDYGAIPMAVAGAFVLIAEHDMTANWADWGLTGGILYSLPADWRIVDYSVFVV